MSRHTSKGEVGFPLLTPRQEQLARPLDPSKTDPPFDGYNWTEPNVDRTKGFPLPAKYEMVPTSGLTCELHSGVNQVDFDLD